jgi:hypothetical protein
VKNKIGYMLETLRIPGYLVYNQVTMLGVMQKISREVGADALDPPETTRRSPQLGEIQTYLQGALHDASRNKRTRVRFIQKGTEWLEVLKDLLETLGHKSWMYREGKDRDVHVLETTADFLDFNFDPMQSSHIAYSHKR